MGARIWTHLGERWSGSGSSLHVWLHKGASQSTKDIPKEVEMNQWSRFTGVITAMVTPFDEAGRLNLPTLRRLIALQMRAGVDGVLVCGGSGEYANLSAEERAEVTQAAVEAAGGQVFVVVGVLEASTARACEAVKLLAAA